MASGGFHFRFSSCELIACREGSRVRCYDFLDEQHVALKPQMICAQLCARVKIEAEVETVSY